MIKREYISDKIINSSKYLNYYMNLLIKYLEQPSIIH